MTFLPIVERELRINARRRGLHLTRVAVAFTLLVIWFLLAVASGRSGRPVEHARAAFIALTLVGLGFTVFAGFFLTADCLSEERREGTLGLLFLTDLKGYDVVLGKLVSTSLRAFYGLLAGMPLLALPLLMGGTTPGEFWRMSLVLCVTLVLSLAVGMSVSALSRESREAISKAFLVMLVMLGVLPVLWLGSKMMPPALRVIPFDWLLWPCPAYAYQCALDSHFSGYRGGREFWISIGAMTGLGCLFLAGAMYLLPRSWQEGSGLGPAEASRNDGISQRFGARSFRPERSLLDSNPFYWLATRDRWLGWRMQVALVLLLAVWFCFYLATFASAMTTMRLGFTVVMFMAYGLHQFLKCMIAIEASRRFSEDRQSGALELLLVTPLDPRLIVTGQQMAMRRAFTFPLFLLILMNAAIILLAIAPGPIHMSKSELPLFLAVFLGGMVLLVLDASALVRVAMWTALTTRRHNRAILAAMGRVMFPPWVAVLFFVFLSIAGGIRSKTAVETMIVLWLIGSAILAWAGATWAARNLNRDFRHAAASGRGCGEDLQKNPAGASPPALPA